MYALDIVDCVLRHRPVSLAGGDPIDLTGLWMDDSNISMFYGNKVATVAIVATYEAYQPNDFVPVLDRVDEFEGCAIELLGVAFQLLSLTSRESVVEEKLCVEFPEAFGTER